MTAAVRVDLTEARWETPRELSVCALYLPPAVPGARRPSGARRLVGWIDWEHRLLPGETGPLRLHANAQAPGGPKWTARFGADKRAAARRWVEDTLTHGRPQTKGTQP